MRNARAQLAAIVLIGGLSFGISACRDAESTAAAAPASTDRRVDVPAVKVGVADLDSTLQISGSLAPQTRVAILAKMSGTLSSVNVQIGDRVRQGQVVATLDRREIDAQVDAATAAVNVAGAGVESAEATLANAMQEYERSQNLFDKGAVPRQRLDGAETAKRGASAQRDLAKANLAQSEAALRRARELQRDATLTSPIDGVIVERNYDPGTLAGPGDKSIVVVADLRVMKLEAGVSELEAGRLRVGMPARVVVQARPGMVFDGRLAAIAPEVDARNRHFAIEVRTANTGQLLSGMYATATIPVARAQQAVSAPVNAIGTRDGRRVAFKIENAIVREIPVTEGLSNGTLVQISSGLQAGDTIVADVRRDVTPGTKVNPVFPH